MRPDHVGAQVLPATERADRGVLGRDRSVRPTRGSKTATMAGRWIGRSGWGSPMACPAHPVEKRSPCEGASAVFIWSTDPPLQVELLQFQVQERKWRVTAG